MRKNLFAAFLFCASFSSASSRDVALVYQNEAAVKSGQAWLGTSVSGGVLISAKDALTLGATSYVAIIGQDLHYASLGRLDNDMNIALVKIGSTVENKTLQDLNKNKSAALTGFFPVVSNAFPLTDVSTETLPSSGQIYQIKINGNLVGDTLELPAKREKTEFQLELIRVSTVPIWNFGLTLKSEPNLAFWEKKRSKDLNDVPRGELHYDYQVMFKTMAVGESAKLSVQVFFIKAEDYIWTLKIKSKKDVFEKQISVKFKK